MFGQHRKRHRPADPAVGVEVAFLIQVHNDDDGDVVFCRHTLYGHEN